MTSAIPFCSCMQTPERVSRTQDLHKTVDRAYITALLLTASAERAEAAILEGHRVTDLDSTPGEALLGQAVNAAIKVQSETSEQPLEDLERASSMLPFELRRVLHLQPALRQCFVLRFLMGLPREVCARLLRLEIRQVDERARTALLELPTIQRNGTY